MNEPRKLCAACAVRGVAACNDCCDLPRTVDWKSRALRAEARIARMQREPAYREDAYELVERELMAAGVKVASFEYWPKNNPCAVGSLHVGGPFELGKLKYVVTTFTKRKAYAEKYHADALARKRRERAEQGVPDGADDEGKDVQDA